MNTKKQRGLRSRKLARLGKYALLGLTCSLQSQQGFSQASLIMDFFNSSSTYYSVKNYTPVIAPSMNPSTNLHDLAMAGTAAGRVHFMRNDYANMLTNVRYDVNTILHDEKLIDMKARVENNANVYYLTSIYTDGVGFTSLPGYTYIKKDVKVRKIDENGNIIHEVRIIDAYGPGEYEAHGLYPMNTLIDDANHILYICGYSVQNSQLTSWGADKKAFVLALNIDPDPNNNPRVIDYMAGEKYNFAPALPVIGNNYDFDMALRMKLLSNGNIAVVGAANAQTGTGSSMINSGTMRLTIQPATTATPLLAVSNGSFTRTTAGTGGGEFHEYGIDIYEDENNGGDAWVVGNKFNLSGIFTPVPNGVAVTYTQHANNLVFSTRGVNTNMGWALQIIPNDASGAGGGDFAIAGLTNKNTLCGLSTDAPSNSNVTTFISQLSCPRTGARIATSSSYHIYAVSTGTDGTSIGAPNYMTYGGEDAHPAWNPVVTARNVGLQLQFLTAPRVMPSSSTLGLKYFPVHDQTTGLMAYYAMDYPDELCGHHKCGNPAFAQEAIRNLGTFFSQFQFRPIIVEESSIIEQLYKNDHHNDGCESGYKPSSVKTIASTNNTQVYPNPATTEVNVILPKGQNNASDVKVLMVNMQGQVVSTLFNGKAEALKSKGALQLPDVATGLYIIQVQADGHMIHQQKLSIQK